MIKHPMLHQMLESKSDEDFNLAVGIILQDTDIYELKRDLMAQYGDYIYWVKGDTEIIRAKGEFLPIWGGKDIVYDFTEVHKDKLAKVFKELYEKKNSGDAKE